MQEDVRSIVMAEDLPELDLSDLSTYEIQPPDYLVEGLLETADIVNLAAFWGRGKTWLAQALSLALADESVDEFLGKPLMRHGSVCYFDAESKETSVRNRLKLLGADSESVRNIHYYLNPGSLLTDPKGRAEIHKSIRGHSPLLVVFDSLTRFRQGKDENSSDQMAQFFAEAIQPISRDYGSAVLLLDHVAKDGRTSRDPDLAARGSGDKAAQTDRLWMVDKHSSKTDLLVLEFGRAKDGPPQEGIVFQRHHEASRVRFEVISGSRAEELELDPHGVARFLEDRGGEAPQEELVAELFGGRAPTASKALGQLRSRVSIRKDPQDGRKNIVSLDRLSAAAENRRLVA